MSHTKHPTDVTEAGAVELTESELHDVAGGNAQYNPKELQIMQKVPTPRAGTGAAADFTLKVDTEVH